MSHKITIFKPPHPLVTNFPLKKLQILKPPSPPKRDIICKSPLIGSFTYYMCFFGGGGLRFVNKKNKEIFF